MRQELRNTSLPYFYFISSRGHFSYAHTNPGSQLQAAIFLCNFKEIPVIKNGTRDLAFALITCFDACEECVVSDSPEFESLELQS